MSANREYIATTLEGLEEVLAEELREIGATYVNPGKRNVSFRGDTELLYRACYTLRTALRVLKPIAGFWVRSEDELYQEAVRLPWRRILGPDQTLAITPVVHSTLFRHNAYPALVLKDAICDRIRKDIGRRPDVDKDNPDIRINLHIYEGQVDISLDASGGSLHQRGYRRFGGEAPLNEVLAAGLLRLMGWQSDVPLIDPMCGSGTILIEAAEMTIGRPAQIRRLRFGFQGWNDYDPGLWRRLRKEIVESNPPPHLQLSGSDSDKAAVENARSNIRIANMGEWIDTKVADFFYLPKAEKPMTLFLNPPYDERLPLEDVSVFYAALGDKLKQDFVGCTVWILSANKEGLKNIGLKSSARFAVKNGPFDAEFCRYDMF
jgi:putative N6-adenine-specific DNA methylase